MLETQVEGHLVQRSSGWVVVVERVGKVRVAVACCVVDGHRKLHLHAASQKVKKAATPPNDEAKKK